MSYSILSSYHRCIVVLSRTKYLWLVVQKRRGIMIHGYAGKSSDWDLGTSLATFLEDASRCGGDVCQGRV
jgi:hypothetical protein